MPNQILFTAFPCLTESRVFFRPLTYRFFLAFKIEQLQYSTYLYV
jgi:hypothetical protein